MANKETLEKLRDLQALPLNSKVALTRQRIREWIREFGEEGVYVSFSGGKDSTVLLDIVRERYPDVPAVFVDVPTQYPELREFVKTFDNVEILRPKMNFMEVCEKYGFPLISKEVSECVYGARKYLTRYIELQAQSANGTERNGTERNGTERNAYLTATELLNCVDQESMSMVSGGEKARWRMLRGLAEFSTGTNGRNCSESGNLGVHQTVSDRRGGGLPKTMLISPEFAPISQELLTLDYGDLTDNLRIQRLMGTNTKDGKTSLGTIPDKGKLSQYSCQRYQFFLEAPFEISAQCCHIMKKEPLNRYARETGRVPITAQMAAESKLRTQVWLKHSCNMFDAKRPMSNPMAFWTEQDVLLYIYEKHLPICSVYGEVVKEKEVEGQLDFADLEIFDLGRPILKTTGCERTGCMLCAYGAHHEKPGKGRFERLKKTHPKMYGLLDVVKNNGVTMREAIEWTNEHGNLHIRL